MATLTDIRIVDYTEKSIAVYGDTKKYKEELKRIGGKYNPKLKEGPGWIFPKTLKENVFKFINENEIVDNKWKEQKKPVELKFNNSSDNLDKIKIYLSEIKKYTTLIDNLIGSINKVDTPPEIIKQKTDVDEYVEEIYDTDNDTPEKPRKKLL